MAEAVYILCALTSLFCAVLLFRSYRRQRTRLLMWSTWCFVGLAVNNLLLVLDLMVVPDTMDLAMLRAISAVAAIALLVIGLLWEDT